MKSLLLLTHLVFAGLWLGCVLTEVLFERALLGRGRDSEAILAELHRRVDLFVEIPAFLAVLLTGTLMVANLNPTPALYTKIAFGALAIIANIFCVRLVLRRTRAATNGQWEEFARLDHLQHKLGAVVLLGILAALGMGSYIVTGG